MLKLQGWIPGTLLGAIDAPHAHLHSDASVSRIRVAIREDNLGLGAKIGSGHGAGECTGLDAFQGLLGRLNGKSGDVLEREQRSRDDLKRALYSKRKWGTLHFVSGGVLVGDKIEALAEGERVRLSGRAAHPSSETSPIIEEVDERKSRRKKKSVDAQLPTSEPGTDVHNTVVDSGIVEAEANVGESNYGTAISGTPKDEVCEEGATDDKFLKTQRKAARAQRKLDRRKRKEVRKTTTASRSSIPESKSDESEDNSVANQPAVKQQVQRIPPASVAVGGRHAVRQRYIRHKQMAVMDPRALNEVGLAYSDFWFDTNVDYRF